MQQDVLRSEPLLRRLQPGVVSSAAVYPTLFCVVNVYSCGDSAGTEQTRHQRGLTYSHGAGVQTEKALHGLEGSSSSHFCFTSGF